MVWAVDFNYQKARASSQKFVKAYAAEYGEQPLNYAAEAYDAAWFLAKSIKQAGSADRDAIKDAMAVVARRSSTVPSATGLTLRGPRPAGPGRRGPLERHRRGPPLRGHRRLTPIAATARRGRPILWTAPTGYGHDPG